MFAPRIRHDAGVRGVFAALREVAAQAGLEVGAGAGAATGGVVLPNEIKHVVGERVERDHGVSGGMAVIAVISSGEEYEWYGVSTH